MLCDMLANCLESETGTRNPAVGLLGGEGFEGCECGFSLLLMWTSIEVSSFLAAERTGSCPLPNDLYTCVIQFPFSFSLPFRHLCATVRARFGRQRDVQSTLQQAAETDAAGGMQYRVYHCGWGSQNVESNCG